MSAESGWRRSVSSLGDEIAWRLARDAGDRRMRDEEPVAVRAGITGARVVMLAVPGGLASLMTALPAIRSLRRELPGARIDIVAEPIGAALLERDPVVDNTFGWLPMPPLRQRRTFASACDRAAERGAEVFFSFAREDDRGLALLAQASGARLRVACLASSTHGIYNVRVVPRSDDRYLVDRHLGFMEALGLRAPVELPVWEVPPRESEVAERLLRLKHLKGAHPLVAFDPGPGEGEAPDDRMAFGAFAEGVGRKVSARGILLSETEQRELPGGGAAHGAEGAEARAMGLAGLRETLAVLSRCDAFVGRNTGFFHAAVSMGLPAVGLLPGGAGAAWRPENHPGVLMLDAEGDAAQNAQLAAQHVLSAWGAGVPGGSG